VVLADRQIFVIAAFGSLWIDFPANCAAALRVIVFSREMGGRELIDAAEGTAGDGTAHWASSQVTSTSIRKV